MKFIVDAQLPVVLKEWLVEKGFDALHTSELPLGNDTLDMQIVELADTENRIVISKDSDFFKLHLIKGKPKQLLMITTGNIKNRKLLAMIEANFEAIVALLKQGHQIVELSNNQLIAH